MVFALNTCEKSKPEDKWNLFINGECIYGEEQIEFFKLELGQIGWNNIIKNLDNPNTEYGVSLMYFVKPMTNTSLKLKLK